jgi:hypothetical protein
MSIGIIHQKPENINLDLQQGITSHAPRINTKRMQNNGSSNESYKNLIIYISGD